MAVQNQSKLPPSVQGVLGLSPEYTNYTSLIFRLYFSDAIESRQMGIFLSVDEEETQSFISFGLVQDTSLITSDFYNQTSISIYYWQLSLSEVLIGETNILIDGFSAIFDSSSPYIHLPRKDY
mmetsp:Transcript_42305/g.30984  ORF Transcript_42305/g.30984 Transcript_42305/m.30984 type:complete len:123 (+) Transcript_42305:123-491(+)